MVGRKAWKEFVRLASRLVFCVLCGRASGFKQFQWMGDAIEVAALCILSHTVCAPYSTAPSTGAVYRTGGDEANFIVKA